jgi:hypothetical protein
VATYKVQWDYASSLGGPWKEGDIVELDPSEAGVFERDSPGVLVATKKAATQDRMVKSAESRDDRAGSAGDQGAMTTADFKAVKDK